MQFYAQKNLTVSTKMPRKYGISRLKYPKNVWGGGTAHPSKYYTVTPKKRCPTLSAVTFWHEHS